MLDTEVELELSTGISEPESGSDSDSELVSSVYYGLETRVTGSAEKKSKAQTWGENGA